MNPNFIGILNRVRDLATNYTAALASTISTNLNATVTSRAAQTTADTINTNVGTLVNTRCTEARMSALDGLQGVPGVTNTLSLTYSPNQSYAIADASQYAFTGTVALTQDTWATVVSESAGTSGILQFLTVESSNGGATRTFEVRLTIDGTVVYLRSFDTGGTGIGVSAVGYAGTTTDRAPNFDAIPFSDGFTFEARNTTNNDDVLGQWRYYRTS